MKDFKRGTPAFGVLCGVLLAGCGALIMWIGFWRTLILAVLFALGYFLGGVQDKTDFVKSTVDKVVPEKKDQTIDFRKEVERDQLEAQRAAEAEAAAWANQTEEEDEE